MEATLAPTIPIDKEAIKTLCKAVGIREGARQLGLPEARVLKWSERDPTGSWTPAKPIPGPSPSLQTVVTPSKAHDNHLLTQKNKSRSNLAKYVLNASKVAARSRKPLEDAPLVDKVANVHAKVWPEEKQSDLAGLVSIQLIRLELPQEKQIQGHIIEQDTATDQQQ